MSRNWCGVLLCMVIFLSLQVNAEEARLLKQPAVSKEAVAFVYANDIWIAPRDGGHARRLTTHTGDEATPFFSPDGKLIAFTGQYDGNIDVFVVPAVGGEPKRLTYHPGPDVVRGWTRDGRKVLFASGRVSAPVQFNRLWTISTEGGMPELLPMPMANRGCYSPDGSRLAYVRVREVYGAWRHYRGGTTTGVWLFNFADNEIEKIPRDNSNDTYPVWIGDKVYFLSDRNHTMNLFSYDTAGKEVQQLTLHDDYDIKYATAGDGVVVYEQAGYIHIFDPTAGQSTQLHIELRSDLPGRRPHFVNVSKLIQSGDISPTGKRVVLGARGDIFTVPAKKGDYRNLTNSSGANDRFPTWSPDGKWIAWFSDAGGEYQLMITDQKGNEPARSIKFENPSFYYSPSWSPDSKKILFADKRLNLWFVDVESGKVTWIDKDTYDHPQRSLDHVWAPDSNWIAYTKRLGNFFHAVFIYSLEEGKSYQVTDGLSDAVSPAFDKKGKYLYFLASTDFALGTGWLDMSSIDRPVTRGVYLIVLNAEDPSPLLPESDEEEVKEEKKEGENNKGEGKGNDKKKKEKEELAVEIDFNGIDQRILDIDINARDYSNLKAGAEGVFFYTESIPNQRGFTLHCYKMKERKAEQIMSGINGYTISDDGKKMLYFARDTFGIVDAGKKAKMGDGKLNTAQMQMWLDPVAEWNQIYLEAWRINRDYLYDEKMHGADWDAMYRKYEPFVDHVSHRSDLNYVLQNLIGELTIGHSWAVGGDTPRIERVPVGLLGADYEVDSGRYRFAKVYTGENWNPGLRAPLTAPGINVSEGEYLLEVNGVELKAPANIYSLFEGTAGKQTTIRINDKPVMEGSRLLTVVPIRSERSLRSRGWVETNRRKVEEMSGGRLAYVYLPNTSNAGYTYFNRYYFAQRGKEGAIIDERFNGGGYAADYFVDLMARPLMNYFATRDGKEITTPMAQIFGPKVMIINEYAGSGGDALPFFFRFRKIGTLVGKRTWGGLVGHHGGVRLIDGGYISSPNLAFYNIEGYWDIENEGVDPDIEIEMTPALVIKGQDPQLERAVEEAMRMLKENPVKHTPRPAPIDRVSKK